MESIAAFRVRCEVTGEKAHAGVEHYEGDAYGSFVGSVCYDEVCAFFYFGCVGGGHVEGARGAVGFAGEDRYGDHAVEAQFGVGGADFGGEGGVFIWTAEDVEHFFAEGLEGHALLHADRVDVVAFREPGGDVV